VRKKKNALSPLFSHLPRSPPGAPSSCSPAPRTGRPARRSGAGRPARCPGRGWLRPLKWREKTRGGVEKARGPACQPPLASSPSPSPNYCSHSPAGPTPRPGWPPGPSLGGGRRGGPGERGGRGDERQKIAREQNEKQMRRKRLAARSRPPYYSPAPSTAPSGLCADQPGRRQCRGSQR